MNLNQTLLGFFKCKQVNDLAEDLAELLTFDSFTEEKKNATRPLLQELAAKARIYGETNKHDLYTVMAKCTWNGIMYSYGL